MGIMPARQLRATVRANTEQYERALREIDDALQAPVDRQFEVERRMGVLLSSIAKLKIEHGAELPLIAAEYLVLREEEEGFVREQKTAIDADLDILAGEVAALQNQIHLTILEIRDALENDAAYNEVRQRRAAESSACQQEVAAVQTVLDKCNAVAERYASSRIYAYLVSIGYGTEAYTGRGSAKVGDAVFSLLCRFARGQQNQQTISQLRAEITAIVSPYDQRRLELQNWLHSMEALAGKSVGMDQLLDRISEVETEIEHRQAQAALIDEELAAYASNTDVYYVHAHDAIVEFMHALDEPQMLYLLQRLPDGAGTEIATEWSMLHLELRSLRNRYAVAFSRHSRARKDKERAKALEFRIETLCSEDVQGFRAALQINKLLDGHMAGSITQEGVLQEIRAHQVQDVSMVA